MMSLSNKIVIFLNLLSVIKVSLLETVHFTNSPNKLLTAKNFTTYKVEVPGSEPITIIEANTPIQNNHSPVKSSYQNYNNFNSKYSINRIKNKDNEKDVVDLKSTLSMTITPDNYNTNKYGDNEESVTNQNAVPQHQSTIKTVYSPELLKKFLKDYSDKLSSTEHNLSQDKLEEIIKLKHKIQSQIEENEAIHKVDEEHEHASESESDENRRQSTVMDHDDDHSDGNRLSERKNHHTKKYYGSGTTSSNHPYNKNEVIFFFT